MVRTIAPLIFCSLGSIDRQATAFGFYLWMRYNMLLRRLLGNFGTIKQFNELQVLNKYLEINKYPYVLVYFTAKWNPACKITDEHISLVSNRFGDIEIIKVDSDVSPQITSHYNVRAEP